MANYASIGSRIGAVIIDHIILGVIMFLVTIPLGLSAIFISTVFNPTGFVHLMTNFYAIMVAGLINIVIWIFYFTYFEGTTGQTPGKKAFDIKVVKENGKAVEMEHAFLRTIFRVIDGIGFYLLGFIIVMVTDKQQRIGDLVADTIVVKT